MVYYMETIDIIMGTYNGEKYIREQIDSILKNSWKQWRLWICDDGSTDATKDIVAEYEAQYPEQIFWRPNAKNKGAAINFLDAARKMNGEYVMFCDQDDYWLPDKIASTLDAMKTAEEKYGKHIPITVFTDARVVDETLNVLAESFHKSNKLNTSQLDLSYMLMENKMMGCTMMLNRTLADKLNTFPTKVRMHDWWVGLIAATFGKIVYLDKPTLLYRQHTANVVGSSGFSAQTVIDKVVTAKKQKQALLVTQRQAEYFYRQFKDEMSDEIKPIVYKFATLHDVNCICRRVSIIKYHFWKSGMIRNIGVMLFI